MVGGRKEPFEGVVLGPLLGKGSFGRVYRALWDGNPVAVKACLPTHAVIYRLILPRAHFASSCSG